METWYGDVSRVHTDVPLMMSMTAAECRQL